jgi:hypothetical protein
LPRADDNGARCHVERREEHFSRFGAIVVNKRQPSFFTRAQASADQIALQVIPDGIQV